MHVNLQKRADGMPDQQVECERVMLRLDVEGAHDMDFTLVTVEFDANSGENGEHRIIVDDECVWSALSPDPTS